MADRDWIDGQVCFMERDEIDSRLIDGIEAHWNVLRGDREMPRRDEIDPVDLARWLPYTRHRKV